MSSQHTQPQGAGLHLWTTSLSFKADLTGGASLHNVVRLSSVSVPVSGLNPEGYMLGFLNDTSYIKTPSMLYLIVCEGSSHGYLPSYQSSSVIHHQNNQIICIFLKYS